MDEKSGYVTRSILCMPIKAGKEVVGVIQLLNKDTGPFDAEDEEVRRDLAGSLGGCGGEGR